jgi:hypothetical protein
MRNENTENSDNTLYINLGILFGSHCDEEVGTLNHSPLRLLNVWLEILLRTANYYWWNFYMIKSVISNAPYK